MGFRLGDFLPGALYKTPATTTWGSTPNACTITDPQITPSSMLMVYVTGSEPAQGRWSIAVSAGSAVITSTDGEDSSLTLTYVII